MQSIREMEMCEGSQSDNDVVFKQWEQSYSSSKTLSTECSDNSAARTPSASLPKLSSQFVAKSSKNIVGGSSLVKDAGRLLKRKQRRMHSLNTDSCKFWPFSSHICISRYLYSDIKPVIRCIVRQPTLYSSFVHTTQGKLIFFITWWLILNPNP